MNKLFYVLQCHLGLAVAAPSSSQVQSSIGLNTVTLVVILDTLGEPPHHLKQGLKQQNVSFYRNNRINRPQTSQTLGPPLKWTRAVNIGIILVYLYVNFYMGVTVF